MTILDEILSIPDPSGPRNFIKKNLRVGKAIDQYGHIYPTYISKAIYG